VTSLRCTNRDGGSQCPLEVRDRSNYCPIHGPGGVARSLNSALLDNRDLRARVARLELVLGLLIAVLAVHMAAAILGGL